MSVLEVMNFDQLYTQPFLYIHGEMPTFQKFIYQSQKDLKTSLKSSILLNIAPVNQLVYIVCDLYSQTNPPLLSPHILVRRHCDPNMLFVIDTMTQLEQGNEMRKYTLENFHILNVPKKRKEESLITKLNYLHLWKSGCEQLTDEQKLILRNKVTYGSYNVSSDDKVYLGFTAYVHDSQTNCKIKYAETEFSSPIYDCSNSVILHPFHGPRSGGSVHVLNVQISISVHIKVHLYDDNGWSASATNVHNSGDSITFTVPPYGGNWRDDDDTRLVYIKVVGSNHDVGKKPIKFLYQRTQLVDDCDSLMG